MIDFSGFADMANMKRGHAEIVFNLDLKNVFADPDQPRKEFDEDSITELAADIKRNGLIQPIVVKHHPDRPGNYLVVTGERRLRAVQKLGESTIKVILKKEYNDQDDLGYIQIAENLKREDLKFYELAQFIISRQEQGESQRDIAEKLGIAQPRISLYISWKTAPDFLKQAKQHFRAIRPFSLLSKLTQDYPLQVQDYVSKLEPDEVVTEKDVTRLRQQITGGSQNITNAATSQLVMPASNDAPATPSDSFSSPAVQSPVSAPAQGALPSASDPAVSYPSFEGRLQPGSNSGDEQQSPQNDTEHPAEGTDQVQDAKRYRKPQILGMVDSRPATLLYREIAEAGCVIVKYQNGGREQILADRFRLKEISEAS